MKAQDKLRREVMRAVHSVGDRMADLYEPFVQRRHDRDFADRVGIRSGGQPEGRRIAILVLFQPDRVLPSTCRTLAHLAAHGFAPWVVANGGVTDDDVQTLLPLATRLIQRPNYGHDFGGYRDGLRLVEQSGLRPTEVLIMNDSIWFPVWPQSGLLERLSRQDTDLGGPMFERKAGRRHAGHFESYMLHVGGKLVEAPEFWRFWRDYPVSGIRRKVLSRGEKGFSAAMRAAGARVAPLASREAFMDRLSRQDDAFLARTLRYAAYDDPAHRREAQQIGGPGGGFRDRALAHVGRVAAKTSIQESFVYAAMTLFDLPLLKKRSKASTVAMRQRFCEAVAAGDLPGPDPVIWDEVRNRTPGQLGTS